MAAYYVEAAYAKSCCAKVRRISADETSARRGHRYVTNVLDAETHKLRSSYRSVRKELARAGAGLKGSLWAYEVRQLPETRSQEQRQQRSALCNRYPKLGRAIGLRDMLQDILVDEDQEALRWWCKRAKLSRLIGAAWSPF